MSAYILLLDREACPACRRKSVPKILPAQCRACGKMLFPAESNLKRYEEETGWMEYYVWTGKAEGWKHRSHLFDRQAVALEREYQAPKLPDDYGMHTTPQQVQQQAGKLRRRSKGTKGGVGRP